MAEYRINSQNHTIALILKALKEVSVGIGFSVLCDIEVIKEKVKILPLLYLKQKKKGKLNKVIFSC